MRLPGRVVTSAPAPSWKPALRSSANSMEQRRRDSSCPAPYYADARHGKRPCFSAADYPWRPVQSGAVPGSAAARHPLQRGGLRQLQIQRCDLYTEAQLMDDRTTVRYETAGTTATGSGLNSFNINCNNPLLSASEVNDLCTRARSGAERHRLCRHRPTQRRGRTAL